MKRHPTSQLIRKTQKGGSRIFFSAHNIGKNEKKLIVLLKIGEMVLLYTFGGDVNFSVFWREEFGSI